MKTIVAIGGGELRDLETLPIDRAIVKLSRKRCPKVLFIPTASNDAFGYWETFQEVYGKRLGCVTDVMFLIKEKLSKKQIKDKIFSADIIYVGGGNTLQMLRVWRKLGLDELLKKAYERGVILSGLSAGAIAWFRYGLSDSRRFMKTGKQAASLMRVSGLGLLPCTLSPHHIREKKFRDSAVKELMKRTPGVALALDDNVAILVQGDRYKILCSKPGVGARKVFRKNGSVAVVDLPSFGLTEHLCSRV